MPPPSEKRRITATTTTSTAVVTKAPTYFHFGPKLSWPYPYTFTEPTTANLFGANATTLNQFYPANNTSENPKWFGTMPIHNSISDVVYYDFTNYITDSHTHTGFVAQGIGGYSAYKSLGYHGMNDETKNWGSVSFTLPQNYALSKIKVNVWYQWNPNTPAMPPDPNNPSNFNFSGNGWINFNNTLDHWTYVNTTKTYHRDLGLPNIADTNNFLANPRLVSGKYQYGLTVRIRNGDNKHYYIYACIAYLSSVTIV